MANVPFTNNWWNPDSTGGVPGFMGGSGMGGGMMGGGMAGGMGSLLQALRGFLGGHGKNPATEGSKELDPIPGMADKNYGPYNAGGQAALDELMKRYGTDATEVYKHLGEGYTQSPGYKYEMEQAMNAANGASAAGGTLGTPYNQRVAQEGAQGVASKDYQNYINSVTGIYDKQNAGYGDIMHTGASSADSLAKMMADYYGAKGNYKSNETGINNQNNNADWNNLIQGIMQMFGGGGNNNGTGNFGGWTR